MSPQRFFKEIRNHLKMKKILEELPSQGTYCQHMLIVIMPEKILSSNCGKSDKI